MNIHAPGDVVRRRDEILALIRSTPIHSQEELQTFLRQRGIHVTQPTLSRDLRELGVAKSPAGYAVPDGEANVSTFTPRVSREERVHKLVRSSLLSAEPAMNLVVVKTPPAAAQPLASAIDAAALPDVLGTVGGDDTIFIALTTPYAATELARQFQQIAGISPSRRHHRG